MELKKYEFTGEEKEFEVVILHRIRALKDFGNVSKGDLGGWIEKEDNLSHDGIAWVGDEARVSGNARVSESALVRDNAIICGEAQISGNATIGDSALIFDGAIIRDEAQVSGNAMVGEATVCDLARVSGKTIVYGKASVDGSAHADGHATISGSAQVLDHAVVYGSAVITDSATVCDLARVGDYANIGGDITFYGDAVARDSAMIRENTDWISITNIGRKGENTATAFMCADGRIRATTDCFCGTLHELVSASVKTYGPDSIYFRQYLSFAELAKMIISKDVI